MLRSSSVGGPDGQLDSCAYSVRIIELILVLVVCGVKRVLLTGVVVEVGVLLALLIGDGLVFGVS